MYNIVSDPGARGAQIEIEPWGHGSSHWPRLIPAVPQICRALCAGPWGITATKMGIDLKQRWVKRRWEVGKIWKVSESVALCRGLENRFKMFKVCIILRACNRQKFMPGLPYCFVYTRQDYPRFQNLLLCSQFVKCAWPSHSRALAIHLGRPRCVLATVDVHPPWHSGSGWIWNAHYT